MQTQNLEGKEFTWKEKFIFDFVFDGEFTEIPNPFDPNRCVRDAQREVFERHAFHIINSVIFPGKDHYFTSLRQDLFFLLEDRCPREVREFPYPFCVRINDAGYYVNFWMKSFSHYFKIQPFLRSWSSLNQ